MKRYLWIATIFATASFAGTSSAQKAPDTYASLAGEFQRLVTKVEANTPPANLRDVAITLEYRADALYRTTFNRRHTLGIKNTGWLRMSLELDGLSAIRCACGDLGATQLFKPTDVPTMIPQREQLLWDKSATIQLFRKIDAKL